MTIKRHWALRRTVAVSRAAFLSRPQSVGLTEPPKSLWYSIGKWVLGASIPAFAGLAFAAYALVSQVLESKSVVTITVKATPDILTNNGLNRDAIETRLAAEIRIQLDQLTLPAIAPERVRLPADLQKIAADAKVEIRGTDFSLRLLAVRLRKVLKREDIEIEISFINANTGIVTNAVVEIAEKKRIHEFIFPIQDRDIGYFPGDLAAFVTDTISPLAKVSRQASTLILCQGKCTTELAELSYLSRLASVNSPAWDDALAKLLWVQFELLYANATGVALDKSRDRLIPQLTKLLALRSNDYSMKMNGAWLAKLMDAHKTAEQISEDAVKAFIAEKSISVTADQHPCEAAAPSLEKGTRLAFAILCYSRSVLGVPTRIDIQQAWSETIKIRKWAKIDNEAQLFAGLAWQGLDHYYAERILSSVAYADGVGAAMYGTFLVELARPARPSEALSHFSRALRAIAVPSRSDEFHFKKIANAADALGDKTLRNAASRCADNYPDNRFLCTREVIDLIESRNGRLAHIATPKAGKAIKPLKQRESKDRLVK